MWSLFLWRYMIIHGIYFGKDEIYNKIRSEGGVWNDSKERPIFCLIESAEHAGLYWAIPLGNWNHRDDKAKERIRKYINFPDTDLRSCFYHLGKTDTDTIFFISDAIPITDKYIEREYLNRYSKQQQIIKNKKLISELERKLFRILSDENANPNKYRQHITDIKNKLIEELDS
ncbi:hypothetical protein SAMN02910384_02769 [Pseudobutyrivibrio sp. ACV-2]|nr:hypothetical protein SAMN02910384_02769 [Pseudobutyrivibrio sp. ACV-2]